jgi:hypothetical protein
MHPEKTMSKVIGGKRYSVATATLLASDEYWDGRNFERLGRNTFLYRTRGGAYFRVDLTQWQGERDAIVSLSREEAKELYEELPEKEVEHEEAFGVTVEEAASTSGRPALYGKPLKRAELLLTEEQLEWLKTQPGGMSEAVRGLIDQAMQQS